MERRNDTKRFNWFDITRTVLSKLRTGKRSINVIWFSLRRLVMVIIFKGKLDLFSFSKRCLLLTGLILSREKEIAS